jgi:hypothetical protein
MMATTAATPAALSAELDTLARMLRLLELHAFETITDDECAMASALRVARARLMELSEAAANLAPKLEAVR